MLYLCRARNCYLVIDRQAMGLSEAVRKGQMISRIATIERCSKIRMPFFC